MGGLTHDSETVYDLESFGRMELEAAAIPNRLQSDWSSPDQAHMSSQKVGATQIIATGQNILVEARHLKRSYGSQLAVKDVSFLVRSGEVLGLLGPNGAGKSTSMMMLAGLLAPDSGDVCLNGQKLDARNLDQRRLFGIVPQEYAIYDELSAVANLMFFGRLYGLRKQTLKARCEEVLDQIGLVDSAHRAANTYSGGMKRRLNFGIALMHQPAILILDEPTLGVDPLSRSHLVDCIHRQTAGGGCVIYASHYMEEAQSICQRVVILDQGEVIANDETHHLLAGVSSELYLYVDRVSGITNELKGLARTGIGSNNEPVVIVPGNTRLAHNKIDTIPFLNGRKTIPKNRIRPASDAGHNLVMTLNKLTELGIRVLSVETQQSTLERLFLQLTGKQSRD